MRLTRSERRILIPNGRHFFGHILETIILEWLRYEDSASIGGGSAGVKLPSGIAAELSKPDRVSCRQSSSRRIPA
jgi:hypothetical protein